MKVAILLNAPTLNVEIAESHIICADGGYNLLKSQTPIAIVGDFDSLDHIPSGITTIKHPSEKNFTDGELALRYAIEKGYTEIVFYGAIGGRLDHVLGNLALLKLANTLRVSATIKDSNVQIYFCCDKFSLITKKNEIISILPYGGNAVVTFSEGLYYPLIDLELKPNDTRGISNIATGKYASIKLKSGEVIIFHYTKQLS